MQIFRSRKTEQPQQKPPKPKEGKPLPSLLEGGVMLPGAIIAGILLTLATGFGIFKLVSFSKKKKQKAKETSLDK